MSDEPRISASEDDADDRSTHEARKQTRGHDSRVDELSEERATHPETPQPWLRPNSLQAPDSRPGMVQRWIRISLRGAEDPRNINMRLREGWVPRPLDSIPDDFGLLGTKAGVEAGRFIVDDLMLCEMPKTVYAQRKAYYDRLTEQQMDAVETDLEEVQVQGHPITKTHRSSVSHPPRVLGRRVEAAEDD